MFYSYNFLQIILEKGSDLPSSVPSACQCGQWHDSSGVHLFPSLWIPGSHFLVELTEILQLPLPLLSDPVQTRPWKRDSSFPLCQFSTWLPYRIVKRIMSAPPTFWAATGILFSASQGLRRGYTLPLNLSYQPKTFHSFFRLVTWDSLQVLTKEETRDTEMVASKFSINLSE